MKTRFIRGTNQFKKREDRLLGLRTKTWASINLICVLLLPVIYFGNQLADAQTQLISPIAPDGYVTYPKEYKMPTLAPLSEQQQSISAIKAIWRKDWKVGVAVARCESGLRVKALNTRNKNGTWDAGEFQVNQVHGIAMADLFNPYANAGYAYALYKEQGLSPWTSSESCWKNLVSKEVSMK